MNPDVLFARDGADPAIAVVTLCNPDKLNAVTAAMWQRLAAIFAEIAAAADLRCVVVRGEGRAFAAGGDLEEFRTARDTLERALAYHEAVGDALEAIAECPIPTVAQILGPCVGGGLEIAAACDLRIAGESSRFGAPINKVGFSMYPGEMSGLLRLAGVAVVKEILLEGRLLHAREAYEKGLLTRVVADAEVEREVGATVARIVAGAPLVARWHKQWIARLQDPRPLSADEKRAAFAFLATDDYREGLAAFLEKRAPRFAGR